MSKRFGELVRGNYIVECGDILRDEMAGNTKTEGAVAVLLVICKGQPNSREVRKSNKVFWGRFPPEFAG